MRQEHPVGEEYSAGEEHRGDGDYTIGEVAEILRVSTRTLRHWDGIGLLQPTWRTSADHRVYTEAELERGMNIMIYRAAGVPLRDIPALLETSGLGRAAQLRRQRQALERKAAELAGMIRAIDELIATETQSNTQPNAQPGSASGWDAGGGVGGAAYGGGRNERKGMRKMSTKKIIEKVFGEEWPGYQEEAEQRWGHTPEWEQSQKVQESMTEEDWREVKAESEAFVALLADAHARNLQPGTDEAAEIVEAHRRTLARWYETSREKQVLLARMYVQDPRFDATYQGHSKYLLTLVEAQAKAEGIDLGAVEWR